MCKALILWQCMHQLLLLILFRTIYSKVLQLENNIVGGKDTVANRILQTLDNK